MLFALERCDGRLWRRISLRPNAIAGRLRLGMRAFVWCGDTIFLAVLEDTVKKG